MGQLVMGLWALGWGRRLRPWCPSWAGCRGVYVDVDVDVAVGVGVDVDVDVGVAWAMGPNC